MKKILALSLCLILAEAGSAFAAQYKEQTFELAPEASYRRYSETGTLYERGVMYGLKASYAYHEEAMLKIEGTGAFGKSHKEHYSGGGDITNQLGDDLLLELRGLVGSDLEVSKSSTLTPYAGLGYRYFKNDLHGIVSSTGVYDYNRESRFGYIPLGLDLITSISDSWSVAENIEFDLLFTGKQRNHFSQAGTGLNDDSFKQSHGHGFRGSVTVRKRTGEVEFEAGPFVRYWRVSESETREQSSTKIFVPKNTTTEIGLRVGMMF